MIIFFKILTLITLCRNIAGAEGAEKILRYLTLTFADFLHFCELSEDKSDRNECAEGALIVKRPFPGSKVGKGGLVCYKSH